MIPTQYDAFGSFSRALLVSVVALSVTFARNVTAETTEDLLLRKIEEQDARIKELERRLGVVTPEGLPSETAPAPTPTTAQGTSKDEGEARYEKGFIIADKNADRSFSLEMNGRLQFRHTAFSGKNARRDQDDEAANEVPNENRFEIERGRLEFGGHVADPRLQFYMNLDVDTDDNHDVKAHDFWFNYAFSEAFDLHVGKAFVPGSREWLEGSTTTHLSDRPMANQYFRPDRSVGVWAIGEPVEGLFYRTMLANGFNTSDLGADDIDTNLTTATSVWANLVGDYGKGRADLEYHEKLAVQLGGSFTYAPVDDRTGEPLPEADAVRLSNGRPLSGEGAYVDGVVVDEYDIYLSALDFALKYRGLGLNSEIYLRSIRSIEGSGAIADDSFTDVGGYIDVGYFIAPKLLEPVLRYSFVDGALSTAHEYAGGVNWYIDGTHLNKLTFDFARLENVPVNGSGPNYRVGQTGWLFRTQWQVGF